MRSEELHSKILGLVSLIGLMGLWACSSDDASEAPVSQHEMSIAVSAAAAQYQEAETRGTTRSWPAPTGYQLYNSFDNSYENFESLERSNIDLFMTHTGELSTQNELHVRLRYSPAPAPSTSLWKLVLPNGVKEEAVYPGDYYGYGFIPRDAADNATISLLTKENEEDPDPTYADGAVLTIQGLKTVAYNANVIIGAKEGPDADHDNTLRAGDFKFHLNTGEHATNYLYFLFDHLDAALVINMRVHADYYALRHIKLKKIHLQTATDAGFTKQKVNVTVTLKANNSGANPIKSITYTSTGDDLSGDYVYASTEGEWIPSTEVEGNGISFLSHFIPKDVTSLIITSTYDVYDTNTSESADGNLIRKECTATNTIPLSLIDRFDVAERGKKYTINLTIKPTYLYVLSEPDLDNPTVTVE